MQGTFEGGKKNNNYNEHLNLVTVCKEQMKVVNCVRYIFMGQNA